MLSGTKSHQLLTTLASLTARPQCGLRFVKPIQITSAAFLIHATQFHYYRMVENLWQAWKVTSVTRSLWENSYEVLKRTAEDRSAWRESTRKKVPKTCCTVDNWSRRR